MRKLILIITVAMFSMQFNDIVAQEKIIDQTIATVGDNIILYSDIENQYIQLRLQGNIQGSGSSKKCEIFESLLFQKLLLNQAQLDSIEVSDDQVESELDRRLRYYIMQFGSQRKFEEFYQKSIDEFKEEFREIIRDQLMVQMMEQKITSGIKMTPSEVKAYFNNIPKDSLPKIEAEYEIAQITKQPQISDAEIEKVKHKLQGLKDRIAKGESFETLARMYSDDPGSAEEGGKLPTFGRGVMYPEFEGAAFTLKKGEVSEIIETKAGLHIIKMLERRGEYVDVRHILVQTKVMLSDLAKSRKTLDSIANLIKMDLLNFADAADKFSDDPNKLSGGLMMNTMAQTTQFAADQIDPSIFFVIDKLQEGEVSKPVIMQTEEDKKAYRLLYLKKRTKPHIISLQDDYDRVQTAALEEKRSQEVNEWIQNKISCTYIGINNDYMDCEYHHNWVKNN